MSRQLTDEEKAALAPLIETDVIASAGAATTAARERRAASTKALDAAQAAYAAAEIASTRAIGGDGDPHAAEIALEAATRNLTVATKVYDASGRQLEDAVEAERRAKATAWQPVYLAGVQRRIDAAKAADAARALLAQAEADHDFGTSIMLYAHREGVAHPVMDAVWNYPCRTEEVERRIWGLDQADPGAGWTVHAAMGRSKETAK